MRSRSWMAALPLVAGITWAASARAADTAVENTVNLQLQITGLVADTCDVEIKPAHPGCQFETVEKRLRRRSGNVATLGPIRIAAKSTCADRDCSFSITVKEEGQAPRTVSRGVRLTTTAGGKLKPSQDVKYYLTAPAVAAKDDSTRTRR